MSISIIVPVYNTAGELLRRCVDSLLGQTYQAVELILVDDGSTDGSGLICDGYARADARVKVIHKPNGGEASARNAGLELASGDFIGFSDSDDEYPPYALSVLASAVGDPSVDLAVGAYLERRGAVTRIAVADRERYTAYEAVVAAGSDMTAYRNDYIFTTVNGKLFRSEMIQRHRIRFPEQMAIGNDTIFVRRVLARCGNIQNVFYPTYIYYKYDAGQRVQGTAGVYPDDFLGFYSIRKTEYEFVRSHADCSEADLQGMCQRTMDGIIGRLLLAAAYEDAFPYSLEQAIGDLIQTELVARAIRYYKPFRVSDNTLIPKYILEQNLQGLMDELRKKSGAYIEARGGKQGLVRMTYPDGGLPITGLG